MNGKTFTQYVQLLFCTCKLFSRFLDTTRVGEVYRPIYDATWYFHQTFICTKSLLYIGKEIELTGALLPIHFTT